MAGVPGERCRRVRRRARWRGLFLEDRTLVENVALAPVVVVVLMRGILSWVRLSLRPVVEVDVRVGRQVWGRFDRRHC